MRQSIVSIAATPRGHFHPAPGASHGAADKSIGSIRPPVDGALGAVQFTTICRSAYSRRSAAKTCSKSCCSPSDPRLPEACRRVAFVAGATEHSAVRVIGGMAGVAVPRRDGLCRGFAGVACRAFEAAMRACERIFRLAIVVESPEGPTIGVVASGAVGAQAPAMMVVLVAGAARAIRPLVGRADVAFLARHGGVQADQRKAREIMIESGLLSPSEVVVAALAARSQLAFMGIILLVA